MEAAKEIIQESLPIKCLEAVTVALYLTAPLTAVQRFAISFKSRCGDMYYRCCYHGLRGRRDWAAGNQILKPSPVEG